MKVWLLYDLTFTHCSDKTWNIIFLVWHSFSICIFTSMQFSLHNSFSLMHFISIATSACIVQAILRIYMVFSRKYYRTALHISLLYILLVNVNIKPQPQIKVNRNISCKITCKIYGHVESFSQDRKTFFCHI